MKRIIAALICVSMCCTLFCSPVFADTYTVPFIISRLQLSSFRLTNKSTGAVNVVSVATDMRKAGPYFYEITTPLILTQNSLDSNDIVSAFQIYGSFDKIDGVTPDKYISFNFSLRCTESKPINFDDALNQYVRLTLPDINTEIKNYVFNKMNDYQYQISFIAPLSGIDYDYINSTYFRFYLPVKWLYDASYRDDDLTIQIMFDDISISFDTIPITKGDVELIINDLDSIDTTVSAIKDQIDTLPSDIATELKGIDLGAVETAAIPYDQLEDMQDIEDQLYDYSDSKVEYIGQSIDQLGSTLNNHIGKVSTGHGLFFTRVFEIEFIRDLVYISLGFGLVAFILRLGRKIQ